VAHEPAGLPPRSRRPRGSSHRAGRARRKLLPNAAVRRRTTARSSLRGERWPLSKAGGDMNAPIVATAARKARPARPRARPRRTRRPPHERKCRQVPSRSRRSSKERLAFCRRSGGERDAGLSSRPADHALPPQLRANAPPYSAAEPWHEFAPSWFTAPSSTLDLIEEGGEAELERLVAAECRGEFLRNRRHRWNLFDG
jgi:hypothetical protein